MIKTLDDYMDELMALGLKTKRSELKAILEHGFRKYYEITKKRGDIVIKDHKYATLCGYLFVDRYLWKKYYNLKSCIKLRMMYGYLMEEYDGYYYFGLTDEEYESYKPAIEKGNVVVFRNIKMRKIKDEVYLTNKYTRFFQVAYPTDIGWSFIKEKFRTNEYKQIAYRLPSRKVKFL